MNLFSNGYSISIKFMIDAEKTMNKLRGEADRSNKTLYLSKTLFAEFESYCDEIAPSRVIEDLMRQFIESSKGHIITKKKSKKASNKKN